MFVLFRPLAAATRAVVATATVTAVAVMNRRPVIRREGVSVMTVAGARSLAEATIFANLLAHRRVPREGRTGDASVPGGPEEFEREIDP